MVFPREYQCSYLWDSFKISKALETKWMSDDPHVAQYYEHLFNLHLYFILRQTIKVNISSWKFQFLSMYYIWNSFKISKVLETKWMSDNPPRCTILWARVKVGSWFHFKKISRVGIPSCNWYNMTHFECQLIIAKSCLRLNLILTDWR